MSTAQPPLAAILSLLLACVLQVGVPIERAPADLPMLVPTHRWALVVGAGRYEHLGKLSYANRDAQAFGDALVEQLGFERDHIRLLTDDAEDPEQTPTAGHILGELEALIHDRRCGRSDLFVFYFCGHGVGRKEGDFLLPTDARLETVTRVGLPVAEVVSRLATAEMRNVLVLVDACREGSANPFGSQLFELGDRQRMAVVLGCEPGTQSYEDALLGHGVFTHFFLESLKSTELRDPISGALWASRVAKDAQRRVDQWSRDKSPPQHPAVWGDGTRDILLLARPPADQGAQGIASFLASAGKLEPQAQLAALGRYADALSQAQRPSECLEVLKTAEQLGPLSADLQFLMGLNALAIGRSVEAARAFDSVRRADPQALMAQWATLVDLSGAVTPGERAAAAQALWKLDAAQTPALLMRMVEAALSGGSGAEALAMTEAALARAGPGEQTRETAFLRGAQAAFRGQDDEALEAFAAAQQLAGSFPTDDMLVAERLSLLYRARGSEAAIELLDSWIAGRPSEGRWYAERAYLRSIPAQTAAELERVIQDARLALARPLDAQSLLLVTRAAGARAEELSELILAQAAAHPQAWQAQVAALFAGDREDIDVAAAEIASLTPRPTQVYVTYAGMVFNSLLWMRAREIESLEADSEAVERIDENIGATITSIVELLTPQAGQFGEDADAWTLLAMFFELAEQHEARYRLFERHLGAAADAGRLPPEVVVTFARACLDTGRFERFRRLQRGHDPSSRIADQLAWLAAAYLAATGDDAGARSELGQRGAPLDHDMSSFAGPLRALLAARAKQRTLAGLLLPGEDPSDPLALALTGLAARALGDDPRTERIAQALESTTAVQGYFAIVGFWKADAQVDQRALALRAAYFQPGNPLLRETCLAAAPEPATFEGTWDFVIAEATGPVAVTGARLTLTALPGGAVFGVLIAGPEEKAVVEGQLDSAGNLEALFQSQDGPVTLLAKLAPLSAYAELEILRTQGQPLMLLDTNGIPYAWYAHPKQ